MRDGAELNHPSNCSNPKQHYPWAHCFASTYIPSIGKSCWIYHQNTFRNLPFFTILTATTLVKATIISCLDSWSNLFPGLPWPTMAHSQHSSQIASFNNVMSLNNITRVWTLHSPPSLRGEAQLSQWPTMPYLVWTPIPVLLLTLSYHSCPC